MDEEDRKRLNGLRSARRPLAGSRADAWAKAVVDRYGGLCHLCDHGGARQADHIIAVTERPDLAFAMSNARPAHGAPGNRCPVCGVYCNQVRGAMSVQRARRVIAERAGRERGTPGAGSEPGPQPDAGRPW